MPWTQKICRNYAKKVQCTQKWLQRFAWCIWKIWENKRRTEGTDLKFEERLVEKQESGQTNLGRRKKEKSVSPNNKSIKNKTVADVINVNW